MTFLWVGQTPASDAFRWVSSFLFTGTASPGSQGRLQRVGVSSSHKWSLGDFLPQPWLSYPIPSKVKKWLLILQAVVWICSQAADQDRHQDSQVNRSWDLPSSTCTDCSGHVQDHLCYMLDPTLLSSLFFSVAHVLSSCANAEYQGLWIPHHELILSQQEASRCLYKTSLSTLNL